MTTKETENPKKTAHDTVIEGNNIQDNIRHIVVQALKNGKIEPETIKQTLNDVIEGASEGVNSQPGDNAEALKQVLSGVDAALGQVAIASKLAIEEASSNIQDFSDHDLKRALHDLGDLESLFFDSLSEVANKGKETTHDTLKELLNHMQSSGSSIGQSVNEILTELHHNLTKDGRLQNIQAADTAKAAADTFARVASGILAGIADSLEPKDK